MEGSKQLKKLCQFPKSAPEDISGIILLQIFEFIWPLQLLKLVTCSKELMKMITHEQVIQSVMLRGGNSGHSRKTLEYIIELSRKGSIWPPSPLRLLALCCGKHCEKKGCKTRVYNVRPMYGVFYCWSCLLMSTQEVENGLVTRNPLFPLLVHPRTAKGQKLTRCWLWANDVIYNGEKCGPIVTRKLMSQFTSQCTAYDTTAFTQFLCDYAPMIENSVLQFYDSTLKISKTFHQDVKKRKQEKTVANKIERQRKRDEIRSHAAELLGTEPYTKMVLNSQYLARKLLVFDKAPSRCTGKILNAIILDCKEKFQAVVDSNFISLPFLSPSETFDSALLEYCKGMYPNDSIVTDAPDDTFDFIVKGQHFTALMFVLKQIKIGFLPLFSNDLLEIPVLAWMFCKFVDPSFRLERLASRIFQEQFTEQKITIESSLEQMRVLFCLAVFSFTAHTAVAKESLNVAELD